MPITQKINVLGVSYGVRATAMLDAINKSPDYKPTFYVFDKQRSPFNYRLAEDSGGAHVVGNPKDVDAIIDFAKQQKGNIDFAVVGPEDPVIAGLGNRLYEEAGIVALCPWQKYTVENSKVSQRRIIDRVCSDANPEFRVFPTSEYGGSNDPELRRGFMDWYRSQNGMVAIKPDKPGYGASVVVAGDHFDPDNEEEAFEYFLRNFENGDVIVEERVDCEEFSGQYMSDGRTLVECPYTRDFKRRLDGDRGLNTGGMATLKGVGNILPFMALEDRDLAWEYAQKIFNHLRGGEGLNPGLLGVPLYIAYAITDKGLKILEINSRFGDPEGPTIIPTSKMSFAEVCIRMREGDLTQPEFDERAGLLIYKVPPNYGGIDTEFRNTLVDLSAAEERAETLNRERDPTLLIYPGSMELRDNGETHALSSRTVASIGFGETVEDAAMFSLDGIQLISDGGLDHRRDPHSMGYWEEVKKHADELRAKSAGL